MASLMPARPTVLLVEALAMAPVTADPLAEWGGAWVVVLVPVVVRFMFPMYVANPLCGGKITFLTL